MARYVRASTANPTGWRPWNSRLEFYIPNTFPLPTAGRGPFLKNPGVCACVKPSVNGGLGYSQLPNFPGTLHQAEWVTHGGYPTPIYRQPARVKLSGLGAAYQSRPRVRVASQGFRSVVTSGTPAGATVTSSRSGGVATWNGQSQRRYSQRSASTNPTQQPGYVIGADAQGNPIYSTPPANQQVVSYDASGNPVYGPATSSRQRRNQGSWWNQGQQNGQSTPGTGGVSTGTIVGTDASGNPIYSTPPSGEVVTGYDAQGNPIYGAAGSAAATTTAAATGTSWFSEDSLGLGWNNGIYLAVGLGLVLILKKR